MNETSGSAARVLRTWGPVLIGASLAVATLPASAQITQRAFASATGTASTLTVNKPTGTVQNDVLIANFAWSTGTTANANPPALTGWTLLTNADSGGTSTYRRGATLYRVAGASEPANYTFTIAGSATAWIVSAAISSFTGVDTANPVEVTGTHQWNASSATITAPGITTLTNNAMVVFLAQVGGQQTFTAGSWNTTSPGALTQFYGAPNAVAMEVGSAGAIDTAAGATGNGTVTIGGSARNGGVLISLKPLAGATTTLGNGIVGTTGPVCPGAASQKLDGFSLVNSSGANGVTALTVTTSGTAAIASVQIWNEAGTQQYFTTVTTPAGNNWSFSGGTTIPVSTTAANFKVLVTYDSHALAPAGLTATTAYVSAFTTVNAKAGTDTADTTLTLDNAAPAAPTAPTCTGASTSQINLSWTNPATDFAGALVVRGPAGGAAPTFVPTDGTTYAAGAQGADRIVAVGSVATASDTGLSAGTAYAYAIYAYDGCTNYSTSVPTSCSTPVANVTTGLPTATVVSCTQITVSAPFTGDGNANSSTTVERGPSSTGPWTAVCTNLTGASPRSCPASGLSNATTYYFRVTFSETAPDTVQGTNPQTIGPFTTSDCRVTPGTATASATSCSSSTVTAPFTGDGNGNSTTTFSRGPSSTGPWTAVCSGITGASPRTCSDPGLAATTTYFYQVAFADGDGVVGTNPQVTASITTPTCTVNNTTIGAVTAAVASCTSVRVTATFTGDVNRNGTATVQYGTGASPATWTDACVVSGPSPRQCTVQGLTASTLYSFRALFADADGVVGTNPTAGVQATTTACGTDTVAPTITLLSPAKNAVVAGADTFKVQVWDAGGLAGSNPVVGQVDGTAAAGFGLTFSANASYSCGTACTVYQYALPAQAAGPHYLAVRATDAAGNVAVLTVPFRAAALSTGAGTLLRRTSSSQLCIDCHNLQTHNAQATSTTYGNWANDCATCHTPHSTKNVFLVREQIETPNSGTKAVDFRAPNGVALNGHATPQASGNGVNVCEVCHTRTKNTDGTARARNSSATDWTKHYTSACTGCHTHAKGFAAGESEGGVLCKGCHADIWNNMQAATAKTSRHTLAIDTFTDDTTAWGSPLGANAASARSCLNMCHHDHPHTITVAPTVATHEYNVYEDATSNASRAATTRSTATKGKTDFDNTLASGGMCVSCHRNPVESTVAPALAPHPAVPQAAYAASAHNYTANTVGASTYTWQFGLHDGSKFDRNCTKCHAGPSEKGPAASAVPFQAVHWSDNKSLLAGTTNPGAAPAGFVCYNCHGNGTTGSNLSNQDIYTQVAKASNHPASSDATHDSIPEYNASAFGAGLGAGVTRHASCLDCHEPHAAKAGTHTVGTSVAGPPLEGAWGAQLSSNPAFWTAPASTNFTKKTISAGTDLEATLCFKCHSSYYGTLPNAPSGGAETDTAKEFNPGNAGNWATAGTANSWSANETAGGFHPVLATAGSNLGAVSLANLVTTNGWAWSTTARNRMACSDCHGSNSAADPMGPHGSTASYILRGPNTTWNATLVASGTAPYMPNGTFCANCHSQSWANSRFVGTTGDNHFGRSQHRVPCWNCHAAIPHGGPRPGILIAPAGAATGVGGAIAGWDTTAPYWGLTSASTGKLYIASYPTNSTTAWGQSNCGCNGTGH